MKLLNEIIELLSTDNSNIENALIKTKVLLHKMGEKELLNWINNEINGYSNDNENIPEYRIITTSVYGNATDGFTTRWNNHLLPIEHLKKYPNLYEDLSNHKIRESISALNSLVESKEQSLQVPIQVEVCSLLAKGLNSQVHVESAHKAIGIAQIIQIQTQIRNRLLDFLLELSDRLSHTIDETNIKSQSKEIWTNELFKHTIFGDNTTIIVGNNNENNSQNIKNNTEELFKILKQLKITDQEVSELNDAIEKDTKENKKTYGDNVKNWLKKVSLKAIENNTIKEISEVLNSFF